METEKRRTPKDARKVEKQSHCSTEDYLLVKAILVLGGLYITWEVIDQRTGFADAPILFGLTSAQLLVFGYVALLAAFGIVGLMLKLKERR